MNRSSVDKLWKSRVWDTGLLQNCYKLIDTLLTKGFNKITKSTITLYTLIIPSVILNLVGKFCCHEGENI
ncbi:hypothetical protein Anas_04428 [Armadillidium nasatum]|uniref:Uncharacterized protein n=1 Tax=Armadillidium nasatum TaxID=96803 RepID=A0A5N5TGF6_9CRUS|nr:hypothetical protein Anas_04428 [Armadillidium nasatum]